MDEFKEQLMRINGMDVLLTFKHIIFGEQQVNCKHINIYNDNEKIGVRINNSNMFILIKDIKSFLSTDDEYVFSSNIKSIKIKLKNFEKTPNIT